MCTHTVFMRTHPAFPSKGGPGLLPAPDLRGLQRRVAVGETSLDRLYIYIYIYIVIYV